MSRYTWTGINTGTLPTHCERIANYWAKLVCFDQCASGKAAAMKYKAVRAFKAGLRFRGLPEKEIHQAYVDTVEMARLIKNADDAEPKPLRNSSMIFQIEDYDEPVKQ